MQQQQPIIQIRNLVKRYGEGANEVRALRGVDLDAYGGEVLLLAGPSGSGKTTLLSMMGAILGATSGSVRMQGREIVGLSERELPEIRRSTIGFVFQGFNLFPALNAMENIELALSVKGVRRGRPRRRLAEELLDRVGLADKRRRYPADLSGGQKQRVAIARALAGDPMVILADEPTAALDSSSGKAVMEILFGLAKDRGRAVVIVTHDSRILHYGDRLVEIEDGRVLQKESQCNAA